MRKQKYSILLFIACSLLSVACQKTKKKPPVPAAVCGGDMSLNKTAPVKNDVFKISRVFAIQRRTTCDGKTTDKRITVKEPQDAYSLSAQTALPAGGEYIVSAYNRTTCDQATIKPRKESETRMEIQFHTSPGTKRTHALKNADNYIDYEFRRCLEREPATKKCLRSEIAERGTVVLRVEYSEMDQQTVREVRDTCTSPDQPKP